MGAMIGLDDIARIDGIVGYVNFIGADIIILVDESDREHRIDRHNIQTVEISTHRTMIYELLYGGYRLGTFPTEAEAVRRAGYLPKGRYTVREWEKDGEFSTFDPSTNKHYCFTNK